MSLHATDHIETALTVTRNFLFPVDRRRWLKLAVIAFFIGSGLNLPAAQFNAPGGSSQQGTADLPNSIPADLVTALAILVALGVVLALLFAVVGAIMEFVFVESLRRQEVTIRRYWRQRWRQGLRLFGFRIALWLPLLLVVLAWIGAVVLSFVSDGGGLLVPVALLLGGIPVVSVLALLVGLTSSFTTVFAVPLMVQSDSGVLDAWRRLWPSIRAEWLEYLVYALVAYALTFAAGLLASFVVGLGALVALIPIAIVALLTLAAVPLLSPVALVVLLPLAVGFVLLLFALSAVVQVPVLTYLRYYALLVLGDIEPAFDIVPAYRDGVSR